MQTIEELLAQAASPDEKTRRSAISGLARYYWNYPDTRKLRARATHAWEEAVESWESEGRVDELAIFVRMDVRLTGVEPRAQDPMLRTIAETLERAMGGECRPASGVPSHGAGESDLGNPLRPTVDATTADAIRVSSVGRRLVAWLVDLALLIPTLGVGWWIWSLIVWRKGKTPGKSLLGMHCIETNTGAVASTGTMAIREFFGKGLLGAFTLGITHVLSAFMILRGSYQTLWDKLAATVVVDDDPGRQPATRRVSKESILTSKGASEKTSVKVLLAVVLPVSAILLISVPFAVRYENRVRQKEVAPFLDFIHQVTETYLSPSASVSVERHIPDLAKAIAPPTLRRKVIIVNGDTQRMDKRFHDLPSTLRARHPDDVGTAIIVWKPEETRVGVYDKSGGRAFQSRVRVVFLDFTIQPPVLTSGTLVGPAPPQIKSGGGDWRRDPKLMSFIEGLPRS